MTVERAANLRKRISSFPGSVCDSHPNIDQRAMISAFYQFFQARALVGTNLVDNPPHLRTKSGRLLQSDYALPHLHCTIVAKP